LIQSTLNLVDPHKNLNLLKVSSDFIHGTDVICVRHLLALYEEELGEWRQKEAISDEGKQFFNLYNYRLGKLPSNLAG
jgi:hypothetical protein